MNDLRLSAFAPRRRFSYAVSFDGYDLLGVANFEKA